MNHIILVYQVRRRQVKIEKVDINPLIQVVVTKPTQRDQNSKNQIGV